MSCASSSASPVLEVSRPDRGREHQLGRVDAGDRLWRLGHHGARSRRAVEPEQSKRVGFEVCPLEGLREVSAGASLLGVRFGVGLGTSADHQHRNPRVPRSSTNPLADLEAGVIREHQIQADQIGVIGPQEEQSRLPIHCGAHVQIDLGQAELDQTQGRGIVLDDQSNLLRTAIRR